MGIQNYMLVWILLASSVVLSLGQDTTDSKNIQSTTDITALSFTTSIIAPTPVSHLTTPDHVASSETTSPPPIDGSVPSIPPNLNFMNTSEMEFNEGTHSPQTDVTNLVMPTSSHMVTAQATVTEDDTVPEYIQSTTDPSLVFQDNSSQPSINLTSVANESYLVPVNVTTPLVQPTPITPPTTISALVPVTSNETIYYTIPDQIPPVNYSTPLVQPTPITPPTTIPAQVPVTSNETIYYTIPDQMPPVNVSTPLIQPTPITSPTLTSSMITSAPLPVTSNETIYYTIPDEIANSSITVPDFDDNSTIVPPIPTIPPSIPTVPHTASLPSSSLTLPSPIEVGNTTLSHLNDSSTPTLGIPQIFPNATTPILPTFLPMVTAQTAATEDETVTTDALISITATSSPSNVLRFSFMFNGTVESALSTDFKGRVAQALADTYHAVSVMNQTRKKREVSASSGEFNVTVTSVNFTNQEVTTDYTVQRNGADLTGSDAENLIQDSTQTLVENLLAQNVTVESITQAPRVLQSDDESTSSDNIESTTRGMHEISGDGAVTTINDYDDTTMPDVTATVITPIGTPVPGVTEIEISGATAGLDTTESTATDFEGSDFGESTTSMETISSTTEPTDTTDFEISGFGENTTVVTALMTFTTTVESFSVTDETTTNATTDAGGVTILSPTRVNTDPSVTDSSATIGATAVTDSMTFTTMVESFNVSDETTTNATTDEGGVTILSPTSVNTDPSVTDSLATIGATAETATAITTTQTTVEVTTIQFDSSSVVTFRFVHNASDVSDSVIAETLAVTLDNVIPSSNFLRRRRAVSESSGRVTVTILNSTTINTFTNDKEVETSFTAALNSLPLNASTVVSFLEHQGNEAITNFANRNVTVSKITWKYLIYYVFNIYGLDNDTVLANQVKDILDLLWLEIDGGSIVNISSIIEIDTDQYEATFTVANSTGTYQSLDAIDRIWLGPLRVQDQPTVRDIALLDTRYWNVTHNSTNVTSISISTAPIARSNTAVTNVTSIIDTTVPVTETEAEIVGGFAWYYIVIIVLGIVCIILLIVILMLCCLRWYKHDGGSKKSTTYFQPVEETSPSAPQYQPVHPLTSTPPPASVAVINETPPVSVAVVDETPQRDPARYQARPETPSDDEPDASPTPPRQAELPSIMPHVQPLVLSSPPSMKMSQETFSPKFRSSIHPIVLPPINAVVSRDVGDSLSDEAMIRQQHDIERHKSKVKLRKRHPRRFGPYEDAQSEIDQVLRPPTPTIIRGPRRMRRGRDSVTLGRDEDPDISMMLGRRQDYPGIYSRNIDSSPSTDSGVASPETIRRKMQSLLDDAFSLLTPSANRNLVGPVSPIHVQPPMVTPGPHPLMHHPDGRTSTPHHREFTPVGSSERTTPNDPFFARRLPPVPNVFQVPHGHAQPSNKMPNGQSAMMPPQYQFPTAGHIGSPVWRNTNYNNSNEAPPASNRLDNRNIPPPNGFQSELQTGERQNSESILQSIKGELSRMVGASTPVEDLTQRTVKKED